MIVNLRQNPTSQAIVFCLVSIYQIRNSVAKKTDFAAVISAKLENSVLKDVSVDEGSLIIIIVVISATNITLKHLNFNLKIVKQDISKRLILDLNSKNSTKIFDLMSSLSVIKNAI